MGWEKWPLRILLSIFLQSPISQLRPNGGFSSHRPPPIRGKSTFHICRTELSEVIFLSLLNRRSNAIPWVRFPSNAAWFASPPPPQWKRLAWPDFSCEFYKIWSLWPLKERNVQRRKRQRAMRKAERKARRKAEDFKEKMEEQKAQKYKQQREFEDQYQGQIRKRKEDRFAFRWVNESPIKCRFSTLYFCF